MAQKWIVREGSKTKGFRYKGPGGSAIKAAAQLEQIDSLRIPPAWRDVHISTNPRAAIQVWGFDARGRKQYKYHPRAVEKGELRKYYRVRQMARDLPALRAKMHRDFRRQGMTKEKVCAGIVLLIGEGFFRVGSDKYLKENNTFGITTMRKSHVTILGDTVTFEYRGKRSITQRNVVVDKGLTRFVSSLLESPGARLFRYQQDGRWQDVDSHDVNDYIESVAQFPYTAKDFRTWGGTLRAATILAELGKGKSQNERKKNVVTAVRLVASELGNTPAICRKSYVHPVVVMKYLRSGTTITLPTRAKAPGSNGVGYAPEESALIEFLDEYFPERRKAPRDE
jgi:DNA topoisomerase-1